ncbi:hypothetical protein DSECCO2_627340 [anaerobic digester metagenome]
MSVGVPITTVAASTRAFASSPISVFVRLNGWTWTPRCIRAVVKWSTIAWVLPCMETKGSTTTFLTSSPVQSR